MVSHPNALTGSTAPPSSSHTGSSQRRSLSLRVFEKLCAMQWMQYKNLTGSSLVEKNTGFMLSGLKYIRCMDVTERDHKPVRCKFDLDIAHVDRSLRRQEFGKILQSNDAIQAGL